MTQLFNPESIDFRWKSIKTFLIRNQYNDVLTLVTKAYFGEQYTTLPLPRFLNPQYCFTLKNTSKRNETGYNPDISKPSNGVSSVISKYQREEIDLKNSEDRLLVLEKGLLFSLKIWEVENSIADTKAKEPLSKLYEAIRAKDTIGNAFKKLTDSLDDNQKLQLGDLSAKVDNFKEACELLKTAKSNYISAKFYEKKQIEEAQIEYETARVEYEISQRIFDAEPTYSNQETQRKNKFIFESAQKKYTGLANTYKATDDQKEPCTTDIDPSVFCLPKFCYERILSLAETPKDKDGNTIEFTFNTDCLTVGTVIWLYYYERMGIFKILGALMDDYNYRGKYTISGVRSNAYSELMDAICTLHRLGMSSNLRDRICTYQRVLGVTIENNLGIESEQNAGFMKTFNKLIENMLEYYKAKQLADAIQSTNGGNQSRSSVATQTSIYDTINLLKQQFEPFQYGRNQINTFLGIATVHATICLLKMLRKEIGIPDQYNKPEEFIPAAYDILITKRSTTLNETNRYIIHDNCASYGYRLLTDIELVTLDSFSITSTNSILDKWLDDVEGVVEGYRNAYSSLPEKAEAIV